MSDSEEVACDSPPEQSRVSEGIVSTVFGNMPEHMMPSVAEILASTDILSAPDTSTTVVRVGKNLAVKFGKQVSPVEAANLRYLSANRDLPIPEVFGTLTEAKTGKTFIVMEMVEGQTLAEILPSLTLPERRDIGEQIQTALSTLRNIPCPGYIGSVGRQACEDGVFWMPCPRDPSVSGPFETEDEMNEGMLQRVTALAPKSYVDFLRTIISVTLQGHRTVFTHADLQPKNIMVRRTGASEDGKALFKVKIIDWEMSGWYPEYWEFCNATICGRFRPEWLEMVRSIMATYPHEYLVMGVIRGILFY